MPATMTNKRILIDQFGAPTRMQICEGNTGGKLIVEGKIGHCDKPTANNRVYSRQIIEREIKRLQPRIEQGSVLGAVDHPGDGKSRVREAGCIVRGLWVESNGEIHGRFEVVEESDAGRNLAAFLRRGAAIGMSSRGLGSTSLGPDGLDYVGEDFRLNTWDFVADPACHDAYPQVMSEDEETGVLTVEKNKVTEVELRRHFPELVRNIEEHAYKVAHETVDGIADQQVQVEATKLAEQAVTEARVSFREDVKVEVYEEVRAALQEDFATKLVRAIAEMRSSVEEEVRSDLASDPETAGAKLALKKIAEMVAPFRPSGEVKRVLDEKDFVIKEMEKAVEEAAVADETKDKQIAELQWKGKHLAYQVFIERNIAGHPMEEQLRGMIGEVTEFKNADELKTKVESSLAAVAQVQKDKEQEVAEHIAQMEVQWEARLRQAEEDAEAARQREHNLRESVNSKLAAMEGKLKQTLAESDQARQAAEQRAEDQAQALAEAVEENDRMNLLVYADERLTGHTRRSDIMEQVKGGKLLSEAAVDMAATRHEESAQETGAIEERIRRALGRGRENLTEDERQAQEQADRHQVAAATPEAAEADRDLSFLGTSLNEQTQLVGNPGPNRR
jgi:hypothetical protein